MRKNFIALRSYIVILALSLTLGLVSCEDSSNPLSINIFSPSDDVKLGQQMDEEIKADPATYPLLNDAQANAYLQNIVNDIIASPDIKYAGTFAYKVQIIKDDKTVNAFATPGEYIYVYTGLLKLLDNEASIAGVLGHEIAHADRRHATNRMTKAYGIQILLGIILGNDPSQLESIMANLFSGLALLENSREDESEADTQSFIYLKSSKWYPGGIKYFFEKVTAGEQSNPSFFEKLLLTHPPSAERDSNITQLLIQNNIPAPTESNIFSTRYQAFVKTLP